MREVVQARFERVVAETVIERFDHKNLNAEVADFRELMPSVENIAMVVYRLLEGPGLVRLEYCGLGTRFIELTGADYALGDGHPNPFNPVTIIPFSLGLEGDATLTIHDVAGRRVATLVDGYLSAGAHRVSWDASAFPSGTYYCRLVSGEQELLRELVLRR